MQQIGHRYLIAGTDVLKITEALRRLKNIHDRFVVFTDPEELAHALLQRSLYPENVLYVVYGAETWSAALHRTLTKRADISIAYVCPGALRKASLLPKKVDHYLEYNLPPEQQLVDWLVHSAKRNWQIELPSQSAQLLLTHFGTNILALQSELDKLSLLNLTAPEEIEPLLDPNARSLQTLAEAWIAEDLDAMLRTKETPEQAIRGLYRYLLGLHRARYLWERYPPMQAQKKYGGNWWIAGQYINTAPRVTLQRLEKGLFCLKEMKTWSTLAHAHPDDWLAWQLTYLYASTKSSSSIA